MSRKSVGQRIRGLTPLQGPLALPALTRRPELRRAPLTVGQQEIWLFQHAHPESCAYNAVYGALDLFGPLDPTALRRAFEALVRRHPALRTRFEEESGLPVQVLADAAELPWEQLDLSGQPEEARARQAGALIEGVIRAPFELSRAPLMRVGLARLGPEHHLLAFTLHHLIADAWAGSLLARELSALYDAELTGVAASLPPPGPGPLEVASWEHGWLCGERSRALVEPMRKQLAGLPPLLDIPSSRPRPVESTSAGAQHTFRLDASTAERFRARCEEEGLTLFMGLLSVYFAVLHRQSGRAELVVGVPRAGRRPETEHSWAMTMNNVAVRADLGGHLTLREVMARVREGAIFAYAHEALPMGALIRELKLERVSGAAPLIQQLFGLQNPPRRDQRVSLQDGMTARTFWASGISFRGLRVGLRDVHTGTCKQDVFFSFVEAADGLLGTFEYSTELFDRDEMERMEGQYRRLLEAFTARPEARLRDVELLSDEERHRLLVEWNDTAAHFPEDKCIHQLFEEQAARTPEATAVVFEGESLTYRQLDERANQLAHHLRTLGVGPEAPVGICVEPSLEMVVAALGVLEAGGAYLPLDPSYPKERLAFMVADSGARVLVTTERLAPSAPAAERVVRLDSDWGAISREPRSAPARAVTRGNLAYVIYTSGSTGRPKGVGVEHGGLLNLVSWHLGAFQLSSADRTTQVAAFSFDAAVWELWPSLACGASVHIAPVEVRADPERMQEWLLRCGATVSFLPTPMAEALLALEWPSEAPLRRLLTGGDRLRHVPARRYPFTLINNYGPTESTVVSTWCAVSPGRVAPPVGRPIQNVRAYVLDGDLRPVPQGVAGELYVGGASLARGYLGRPELTAERFLPDPFCASAGARLYRTGDLARFLSDGSLEYLGRADFQVKLRGFRIELGEVESALLQQPSVAEAVVALRDERLVAYVVARSGHPSSAAELREALKAKLPEYMVPSAFVFLGALPLTPNGKVDRKALPTPTPEPAPTEVAEWATALERLVATLWQEVLGVGEVRPGDTFFSLGGHSLRLAALQARLKDALAVDVPFRRLFEDLTVPGMARLIRQLPDAGQVEEAAALYLEVLSAKEDDLAALLEGG